MPYQCVVSGCYSLAIPHKISLFEFPSDVEMQKKWIHFVASKNKRWRGCSSSSRICSDHFHRKHFLNFKQFRKGHAESILLKQNACPAIYPEDSAFRAEIPSESSSDDDGKVRLLKVDFSFTICQKLLIVSDLYLESG